jgi:15-cis-phytoene synthase
MSKESDQLKIGFEAARRITKKYARTFYLSSLFLPKEKRIASYAVYAICRISDESVDSGLDRNKKEALNSIKNKLDIAYSKKETDNPLLAAFRFTVQKYGIPKDHFKQLLEGMEIDLEKNRYANFKELYSYCFKAAGVVGLIMVRILENRSAPCQEYAINLGIAMQLTNIIRDIGEDLQRNRIYIPADEMDRFKVTEETLRSGTINEDLKNLLDFQISRAIGYYYSSQKGIGLIRNYRCRFVVLTMKDNYARILSRIKSNNYDIFCKRAGLNLFCKIIPLPLIAAKSLYHEN